MPETITTIADIITGTSTLIRLFTDKHIPELIQTRLHIGAATVMLTQDTMSDFPIESQWRIGHLAFGSHINPEQWSSMIQTLQTKQAELDSKNSHVLLVSDHRINISALFTFGWFFDSRSGYKIIYTRSEKGKVVAYPLEHQSVTNGVPILEKDHELAIPNKGYKAIAIYLGCTHNHQRSNLDPFHHFVKEREKEFGEGMVYQARFMKQATLSPKTDLVGAGAQIDTLIRDIRNSQYCEPGVPVYLCLNAAAPLVMAVGTQLGVHGNLVLCTYDNDLCTYQESVRLMTKHKNGAA